MQINNNINSNKYLNHSTPFQGLTSVMARRISTNPDYLENLSNVYRNANGSVGNLPKDLFAFFRTTEKTENALKIAQVKDALNDANAVLAGIEDLKIQIGRQMKPNNLINNFLPKIAKLNIQPERIPRIITEMTKRFTPDKEVLNSFAQKAGSLLEERFRKIGILSDTDSVKLTYLEQGKYKNTFKMRLVDKDDKDIIHPKVLLSFKSSKSAMEQINVLLALMKSYFQNIKPKDYLPLITNVLDHASMKVVPPKEKDLYKKSLLEIYSKMKMKNEEDKFMELIKKTMFEEIKYNGVGPESNITQFIKRSAGHPMAASDYIDIFYLNTLHNVGLSEYSDKALPPVSKRINLHKYGLFHDDLITNKNNEVEGRVIDYGGIKPLTGMHELSDNRIARRYYHKISQIYYKDEKTTQKERVKYWNNLYNAAMSASIPNHKDILLALEKGKNLIKPEYWHLLSDIKAAF